MSSSAREADAEVCQSAVNCGQQIVQSRRGARPISAIRAPLNGVGRGLALRPALLHEGANGEGNDCHERQRSDEHPDQSDALGLSRFRRVQNGGACFLVSIHIVLLLVVISRPMRSRTCMVECKPRRRPIGADVSVAMRWHAEHQGKVDRFRALKRPMNLQSSTAVQNTPSEPHEAARRPEKWPRSTPLVLQALAIGLNNHVILQT